MRLVVEPTQLAEAIISARREATSAFGNGELILERAITTGRHIEIQVAADEHGNVIHLGERDCSLQRRHQKVVEEAPSPFVDLSLREAMGLAAVNAAEACAYRGVGTVEFLVAQDRSFSFLEMNTRLQVEHPVTELVTGVDLVDLQLSIAQGERLPLTQSDVSLSGHAIEIRIYAEDPSNGFIPQTGPVLVWDTPAAEGLRVDTGICSGDQVSPYYDPMLAKVVAFGATRELARERLQRALTQITLLGVTNNQQFLHSLLGDPVFVDGEATITYLDQHSGLHTAAAASDQQTAQAMTVVACLVATQSQPAHLLNWSNAEPMSRSKRLRINDDEVVVKVLAQGQNYHVDFGETVIDVKLEGQSNRFLDLSVEGVRYHLPWASTVDETFVQWGAMQLRCADLTYERATPPGSANSGELQASTEGLLVALDVAVGDRVSAGQTLAVVEAMKMQHRHVASGDGVVMSIGATLEAQVSKGQLLVAVQLDSEMQNEAGEPK
jgi:geranyl-CoA carboxylase alpha subunit